MKLVHRLILSAAALLALWAAVAYHVSRPPDAGDYLRTVTQVATSAHDAAATGVLVGRQQLRGGVTDAYAATAYDDGLRAVAGAQRKLAGAVPPDDGSAALRDRLSPLVQATARDLTDAARAADDPALRAAVEALDENSRRLAELIEEQR
ncbi:hypothetical protein ACGFIY_10690 [Micromonospora chersina]|uniref:hypothetical protein n=1 Tax=Micromonospora chersina TaxID=47854 RepID=UPI0037161388